MKNKHRVHFRLRLFAACGHHRASRFTTDRRKVTCDNCCRCIVYHRKKRGK